MHKLAARRFLILLERPVVLLGAHVRITPLITHIARTTPDKRLNLPLSTQTIPEISLRRKLRTTFAVVNRVKTNNH